MGIESFLETVGMNPDVDRRGALRILGGSSLAFLAGCETLRDEKSRLDSMHLANVPEAKYQAALSQAKKAAERTGDYSRVRDFLLMRLYNAHKGLAKEFERMPQLQEGVTKRDALALETVVKTYRNPTAPQIVRPLFERLLEFNISERQMGHSNHMPFKGMLYDARYKPHLEETPYSIRWTGIKKLIRYYGNLNVREQLKQERPYLAKELGKYDLRTPKNIYDWTSSNISKDLQLTTRGYNLTPLETIREGGECADIAILNAYLLDRAKHESRVIDVFRGSMPHHTAAAFKNKKDGLFYTLDTAAPDKTDGIRGPFKSWEEAGYFLGQNDLIVKPRIYTWLEKVTRIPDAPDHPLPNRK